MTTLQQLSVSQNNKEVRINEIVDCLSVAGIFSRRPETTTGLIWGYHGGTWQIDGVQTAIANGTVTLTASTTNYVQVSRVGVVSTATTRDPALAPLYAIVTGTSGVTSYTDERGIASLKRISQGVASIALTTANVTLSQDQALCETLNVTGALTAVRNLVAPLVRRRWTITHNGTGFGVQIIGATGTGITVGIGKVAIVECDGTNVFRVTADV